jgi:hypothetical protein
MLCGALRLHRPFRGCTKAHGSHETWGRGSAPITFIDNMESGIAAAAMKTQMLSRRSFLAVAGGALASPAISLRAPEVPTVLDHILLGSRSAPATSTKGSPLSSSTPALPRLSAASILGAARATRCFRSATGIILRSSLLTPPSPMHPTHMAWRGSLRRASSAGPCIPVTSTTSPPASAPPASPGQWP